MNEEIEREALATLIQKSFPTGAGGYSVIWEDCLPAADEILAAGRQSESQLLTEAQLERDAALEAAENYRAALIYNAHTKIAALSAWIDLSYPPEMIGTELHVRRRVDKLMEETGEVGQALGGWFGENPRKGVTHGLDDVLGELLDVAITALGAYESLTLNTGASGPALNTKIDKVLTRVGIEVPRGRTVHAEFGND